jgi:hypothetical protein
VLATSALPAATNRRRDTSGNDMVGDYIQRLRPGVSPMPLGDQIRSAER